MDKDIRIIEKCRCLRCSYTWWPRKDKSEIKLCPRCKSPNWNKERTNLRGLKQGTTTSIHEIRDRNKRK